MNNSYKSFFSNILKKHSASLIIEDQVIENAELIAISFFEMIFDIETNPQLKKKSNVIKDFQKLPDFHTLSVTNSTGNTISIDEVRTKIAKLNFSAIQGKYKCLYIKSAGDLSHESQNTLLKTLEEPPKYTYIIMTVTSKYELLPTILSRSIILNSSSFKSKLLHENYPQNLKDAFDYAEKISKNSDPKKKRSEAEDFFDFMIELANQTEDLSKKYMRIEKLLKYRRALTQNANLRLALENGIIEVYT